jgi:stearoyl-CoA desaturase (delta-9 desaturase)
MIAAHKYFIMKIISDSQKLFIAQLLCHLSIIPMILYASINDWLISLTVYFFTGCIGMTVTYHRLLSHKSWNSPNWFKVFGTLCGTLGLTGSSLGWVANHRKHHRFTDVDGDPHSPHVTKWYRVQWLSMFMAKAELIYVKDLLRDPVQLFFHKHYWTVNFSYVLILLIIDPFAIVYAYMFPAAVLWNAGSFINTLGHMFGYRRYKRLDQSTNNALLGYIVWGEGWHNNHHGDPGNPNFSRAWWEVDIGYWTILCLKK